MKLYQLLFTAFALNNIPLMEAQLPSGFVQYSLAEGLNPTDMAVAPDGRIFVAEKNGLVRVVEDGEMLHDPFTALVVDDFNERGLGHIALHPLFPDSPFVYFFYTVKGSARNRVSRVRANGNYAVPGSEQILYETDVKLGSVHNGGAMVFGTDGKLYISTGENGFGDPATNLNNDSGKVLRLNADGSIPADNPFFNVATGKYQSVYAKGFRNPFSMAVQPETGRIFLCDVGGSDWEEINDVLPSKDYGWPVLEGKASGQSLPANYKDPLFSYDHGIACAVVGAAFYPQSGGSFPTKYTGKFFFADYCNGFIGVLNPLTGSREQDLVTGVNRPVCIRISAEGDLYYLARAGLGGGSEADNTASNDGSLWRVAYTGSNAPFVFGHPKGGLYPVGDTVALRTFALGQTPLTYRWQKNGTDIPGADSSALILAGVQLQDSAALFRCVINNTIGADTSDAAMLRVTSNQRPAPIITSPSPDFLYRAGEAFSFAGHAGDPEEGALPASALTWKIDFHHDEHTHPALAPVEGLTEGTYYVADEGEPDDHVWYRIYLTAKDSMGLSRTTWKEVYPQTTHITVATTPPGIPVNADGLTSISPYTFHSVVGLKRSAVLPVSMFRGDSVLVFNQWHDGSTIPQISFTTPAVPVPPFEADYHVYRRSNGFGLYAEFFNFDEYNNNPEVAPIYSRIDTVIDFEWLEGSPEPGYVPNDNFAVRWTGDIVPFFDDTLTFYATSDDGMRLWINDSLLIDKWQTQPQIEYSATIFLEGGRRYPIRMEVFDAWVAAAAQLRWGSTRLPKSVVPKSQLYPPKALIPNTMSGFVWLDSLHNGIFDAFESPLGGVAILLFDRNTNDILGAATTDAQGRYSIDGIPAGTYRGYALPPYHDFALGPGYGLDTEGYTPEFSMTGEEQFEYNFSFLLLRDLPTASRSWSVSPNPGSGLFRFKKHFNTGSKSLDIRVYSSRGKLVLEKQLAENEWETTLDMSGMIHGVYLVVADGKQMNLVLAD